MRENHHRFHPELWSSTPFHVDQIFFGPVFLSPVLKFKGGIPGLILFLKERAIIIRGGRSGGIVLDSRTSYGPR